MNALIITLRLIHILAAIFWVGGSIVVARFVVPTARRVGPDGAKFVQSLAGESGLTVALLGAGWLAVIAGGILFVIVSNRFDRGYMSSPMGITLSIGAAIGILAALHGTFVQAANARRLGVIGQAIIASGGPPKPEQLAQMSALQDKLERGGAVSGVLVILAAAAMAIARYV